jgi:hypothetical protein
MERVIVVMTGTRLKMKKPGKAEEPSGPRNCGNVFVPTD